MTVTTGFPDVAMVVRVLSDANVQFVVVGEPAEGDPLRLVISRHPTNLDALSRALDRLGSTMRSPGTAAGGAHTGGAYADSPRRVGEPLGTISVATAGGNVDLLFGGARRSLYAEVALHAQEREVAGLRVRWTGELPAVRPAPRATSRVLGRRLLSLAENLAHLMERHGEDDRQDGGSANGD
jgi:hypothetical protein